MTHKEEQAVNRVFTLISEMREENKRFREDTSAQVNILAGKVDKKHLPVMLEDEIMKVVDTSLSKALHEALTGYNSPLTKFATNVVDKYRSEIESIFSEVVGEAIKTDEFKLRVREVLLNKIAKTMISGVDGSIDKTINLMKQDAVFRSRLTLSVNVLVDEFLTNPNGQTKK
jgi:hypothetical protein